MLRKIAMFAAVMMVCMPIGGLNASGPIEQSTTIATVAPLAQPWMVAPIRLLMLCAVLLISSKIQRVHQRQMLES